MALVSSVKREKPPVLTPNPRREVPVVEFRDVTKLYDGGSVGVDRVSMRIGRGEFVFLVGPTGCGKSTCIRLLMKELEAQEGEILISGHELRSMPRKKVPRLRRNIGVVFQDFKLLPNRTVYDNVAYSLEVIGESRQAIRRASSTSSRCWSTRDTCSGATACCRSRCSARKSRREPLSIRPPWP